MAVYLAQAKLSVEISKKLNPQKIINKKIFIDIGSVFFDLNKFIKSLINFKIILMIPIKKKVFRHKSIKNTSYFPTKKYGIIYE